MKALILAAALAMVPLTASPATAATTPQADATQVSGCGHAATPGTVATQHLRSGGRDRSYLVHVPKDYAKNKRTSVILSFHGHKRTSQWQRELSGFDSSSSIAVYPQGVVGTDGETAWQGAPYSAPGVDDVRFTKDILDQLETRYCVAPQRIYAAGKSNGGGFTGLLACRMSDRIAAFAPVSGAFYPQGGACHPSRAVPILDFHGGADTTIPYDGNPAKGLPAIPDWLSGWAKRDGCRVGPLRHHHGDDVEVSDWRGCRGDSVVRHYRIADLGHVWPSTTPNPDSAQPTVLDATPIIERFFAAHPLPR
jgi:polyhydroxybutyrate depolymerase